MQKKSGFKHQKLDIRIKLGVSALVGICVFLLTWSDLKTFDVANNTFSDRVYQTESVSVLPITIVKIDEKTVNALGQPSEWDRQVYADLVNLLDGSGQPPAVITFDLLFTGYKGTSSTDSVNYADNASINDSIFTDTSMTTQQEISITEKYRKTIEGSTDSEDSVSTMSKGDYALVEAVKKYGNIVVGIYAFFSEHGTGEEKLTIENLVHLDHITFPYKELNEYVSLGLVNCDPDQYDYITTAYTGFNYNNTWYDSLSISTLKKFKEYVSHNASYAERHPDYIDIQLPDYSTEAQNKYRFSYSEGPGGFDSVSLIDILTGDFPATNLANNIVMIGAYAPGFQDDFKILFANESGDSRMYGVEIHANIMEAAFEGRFQTDADKNLLALIYSIISALLCYTMLSLNIIKGNLLSLGTLIVHLAVSLILYKNGIYIMLLNIIITCVILSICIVIYHYVAVRSERVKINNAFRMYVAPEIVDDVASTGSYHLQLGGRNKDIAVLFVDIRGFTTMSENLQPEEVVEILNEYFGVITDAIFRHKGTLDKFIGDAAMAVFNSPFELDDYVYRAVATACDIAKASEALGEKLMERFGKKVSYGIGVNCGEAIIGNIGSKFRMDYTAIGDTVNTSSRLESNAKAGEILISEEVKKRLGDRIKTEDVGEIPLKGKHNKIFVYRVMGLADSE